jgi:hypothetical protein
MDDMVKKVDTADLIAQNNRIQMQLEPDNRQYFGDLVVYVRARGIFRSEPEIETLLLEIGNDLVRAQADGESAEAYFGKNPKVAGDELLAAVRPVQLKDLGQYKRMVGVLLIAALGFNLVFSFLTGQMKVEIFNGIFVVAFGLVFSFWVLWLIAGEVYKKVPIRTKVLTTVGWGVGFAVMYALSLIMPKNLTFTVPRPYDLGIIIMLLVGYTVWAVICKTKRERSLLPFLWTAGVWGFIVWVPQFHDVLAQPDAIARFWWLIPIMIFIFLLALLPVFQLLRQTKQARN